MDDQEKLQQKWKRQQRAWREKWRAQYNPTDHCQVCKKPGKVVL